MNFEIYIDTKDLQLIQFAIMAMVSLVIGVVLILAYHHFLSPTKDGKQELAAMKKAIAGWFFDEDKNYAYLTLIFGIVFFVPGFQFVLENYALMKTTGNRDHCYFNEKCFIPSYW